jgi:hypothetical protein
MEPAVIVLIVFGSCGAILWKIFDSRHKQVMAMIEKGVSASDLKGNITFKSDPISSLKWGLVALFAGLGILFANYLDEVQNWGDASYPSMILIFGGVSLIVFYAIAARKEKREG